MRKIPVWAGLALALLAVGCSSGDSGLEVSGTVMFKGTPLDQGSIQFFDKEKNQISGGSAIKDGKFTVPGTTGIKPGTYRVVISSGEAGTKVDTTLPPGESGPPAKERIPAEYNSQSIQKPVLREIKKGEKLDFDIK